MPSTYFEIEGSSSGRRLPILMHVKYTIPCLDINRLPEDEPSGSKYEEEDIKYEKLKY